MDRRREHFGSTALVLSTQLIGLYYSRDLCARTLGILGAVQENGSSESATYEQLLSLEGATRATPRYASVGSEVKDV